MNKPNYRSAYGEFITRQQAAELTNLGTGMVDTLSKEADARIRIGKCVRINKAKLLAYIEKTYTVTEAV